jgi:methyl-accepting chemotaxis protein
VEEGATQVGSAAAQVSSSSQLLAQGASEQAATVEETSASLEEISSMTKGSSDHAARANDLARRTRESAEAGMTHVTEMNRAMNDIQASSSAIAKIVSTIEQIAFQTNILALNAAVEAARAGQAGAGFSVVAGEVRSLARQAAGAAAETATMIGEATKNSSRGVEISGKVSAALNEILGHVRQVDETVREIAMASKEQSAGISQLNLGLGQMDKVTQANASSAEENAAAAEELNAQATSMQQAIGELRRLVDTTRMAAAVSSEPPPTRVHSRALSRPSRIARSQVEPSLNFNRNSDSRLVTESR